MTILEGSVLESKIKVYSTACDMAPDWINKNTVEEGIAETRFDLEDTLQAAKIRLPSGETTRQIQYDLRARLDSNTSLVFQAFANGNKVGNTEFKVNFGNSENKNKDKDFAAKPKPKASEANEGKHYDEDDAEDDTEVDDNSDFLATDSSETDTLDSGPRSLPPDLDNDERLTNPRKWRMRLEDLEEAVFNEVRPGLETRATILSLKQSRNLTSHALSAYERLVEAGYCTQGITVAIVTAIRSDVVSFVRITPAQLREASRVMDYGSTAGMVTLLQEWGLAWTSASLSRDLERESTNTTESRAGSILAKSLCFSMMLFAGAHLERFDLKFLGKDLDKSHLGSEIFLRRRHLGCLDAFLHGEPMWVLEELADGSKFSQESLSLSTTVEELAYVWEPVFAVTTGSNINNYKLGLGCLVPWNLPAGAQLAEPNEQLAHWTTKPEEIPQQVLEDTFQEGGRLLIGAQRRLSTNANCALSGSKITLDFKLHRNLLALGTKQSATIKDAQNVQVGLNVHGAQVSYGETWKRRAGTTYKEAVLGAWVNEPHRRNPNIVRNTIGVEISACTRNARRQRLARVLGSQTLKNYLTLLLHDNWATSEAEQRYFEVLNGHDINAFADLYLNRPDLREKLGQAVALSLEALLTTGLGDNKQLCALWVPDVSDAWVTLFPFRNQRWVGMLADTIDSGSVAICTEKCLELRQLPWLSSCRNPPQPRLDSSSEHREDDYHDLVTVLETSIQINKDAQLPRGLQQRRDHSWSLMKLPQGVEFDLGDSGKLVFVRYFKRCKGCLMKWEASSKISNVVQDIRERVLKSTRRSCHFEKVDSLDWPEAAIRVYVRSK
jgi:hypothetical protein